MTKKLLALLLAIAMMLALVACGGNNAADNTADSTVNDVADSTVNDAADSSADDTVGSDTQNDAQNSTQNDAQDNSQDAPADETPAPEAAPALNRIDFTLKNIGDSFRLEVENLPEGAEVMWSISDESVATIAEDGTVTAVAGGTATATAAFGDGGSGLSCIVRVAAETAAEGGAENGDGFGTFLADVMGKYELPMGLMEVSEPELIDNFFVGLSDIATEQVLVCLTMMGPMNGEIVAVEVSDSADVAAVEKILKDRVAYMIESGAFYPEAVETWEKHSRVISEGNFVLLVTSASCDAIVEDFRAFVK